MLGDPLEGLSEDDVERMKDAKFLYDLALTKDESAQADRVRIRDICLELRAHGVGVSKIARYLNVSASHVYKITEDDS